MKKKVDHITISNELADFLITINVVADLLIQNGFTNLYAFALTKTKNGD